MASIINENNGNTCTLPKEKVIEERQKYLAKAQYTFYQKPVMLVRGQGQYAWDETGKKYLDGYANVVHGRYNQTCVNFDLQCF